MNILEAQGATETSACGPDHGQPHRTFKACMAVAVPQHRPFRKGESVHIYELSWLFQGRDCHSRAKHSVAEGEIVPVATQKGSTEEGRLEQELGAMEQLEEKAAVRQR